MKTKKLTPNQLIYKTKKFFINKFPPDERKNVKEKLDNICGKTTRGSVPEKLFQNRTARYNRVLIPYEHVINNNLSYSNLMHFEGGVAVEFINNDYFDQLDKPENEQSSIFKELKDKLGTDTKVSAIISIRSTGLSSSNLQKSAYKRLKEYLREKHLDEQSNLLIRWKDNLPITTPKGVDNDKWEGFIFYEIKGGDQNSIKSHDKRINLFNPSVEYASKVVSKDITLVLLYFAIHSIDITSRDDKWESIKTDLEDYLSKRTYLGKSLKDYVTKHPCLNIKKHLLYDIIQVKPIKSKYFALKTITENSLDIAHESSVKDAIYSYDDNLKEILSPANPINLFWSLHLSNMMQQNFSINDFFSFISEIYTKWKDEKIKDLLPK
ncbi:hypothetical protein [Gemella sanguinis]|jgi:hypothetical protein|uniref:hypothetical protein n=1 Tax=Gemella sanguinis TaxID=84135 RepID=UPI000807662F|nr:hypothetical protein [Gemella sanguinis]